jgi:hypothetical protein
LDGSVFVGLQKFEDDLPSGPIQGALVLRVAPQRSVMGDERCWEPASLKDPFAEKIVENGTWMVLEVNWALKQVDALMVVFHYACYLQQVSS